MQRLGGAHEPLIVIDYAHTPDALEKALATLAEIRIAAHCIACSAAAAIVIRASGR
nr:cyanophycin synthetase [Paludibacterium denitrificans]